ncbi:class I glutamine amidotransferase-like protein [Entophlyctis helioformis]|nr:class I glutamine amidotransferase-like protein [Entophlyctis helioformis]
MPSPTTVATTAFDATAGELPPSPQDFDAVVMTGSKFSAHDTETPWIQQLKAFIRKVVSSQSGPFVIGICFGHQIIAEALGGKVAKNTLGWEVGWTPIELTQEGSKLFAASGLAPGAALVPCLACFEQDHVVEAPPGFQVTGSTQLSPVQIMHSDRCFSVQGHPEFSSGVVRELIHMRRASGVLAGDACDKWLGLVDRPTDGLLVARSMLHFLAGRQP